jgi:hypothetical protein
MGPKKRTQNRPPKRTRAPNKIQPRLARELDPSRFTPQLDHWDGRSGLQLSIPDAPTLPHTVKPFLSAIASVVQQCHNSLPNQRFALPW